MINIQKIILKFKFQLYRHYNDTLKEKEKITI